MDRLSSAKAPFLAWYREKDLDAPTRVKVKYRNAHISEDQPAVKINYPYRVIIAMEDVWHGRYQSELSWLGIPERINTGERGLKKNPYPVFRSPVPVNISTF